MPGTVSMAPPTTRFVAAFPAMSRTNFPLTYSLPSLPSFIGLTPFLSSWDVSITAPTVTSPRTSLATFLAILSDAPLVYFRTSEPDIFAIFLAACSESSFRDIFFPAASAAAFSSLRTSALAVLAIAFPTTLSPILPEFLETAFPADFTAVRSAVLTAPFSAARSAVLTAPFSAARLTAPFPSAFAPDSAADSIPLATSFLPTSFSAPLPIAFAAPP